MTKKTLILFIKYYYFSGAGRQAEKTHEAKAAVYYPGVLSS